MKIDRGDIVRIKEHDYAVFFVSEDILGLIRTDKVEFINYDTKLFFKEVNSGKLSIAPKEKDTAYPNVPAEEMERGNKIAQLMNFTCRLFNVVMKSRFR